MFDFIFLEPDLKNVLVLTRVLTTTVNVHSNKPFETFYNEKDFEKLPNIAFIDEMKLMIDKVLMV